MLIDLVRELIIFYPALLLLVFTAGGGFVFFYPIVMSVVWICGAFIFYWRYERTAPPVPELTEYPLVSVLIPARNEEESIRETVEAALASHYPNLEVIVINDASTEGTLPEVRRLAAQYNRVRYLHFEENMGKANALNYAFFMSKGDILVCIDADCILDPWAVHWMVSHFKHPRVGAVTGNPRVRNRTTLLAKVQTAEYASVIGLIKRTQRLLGKVMTVSGVIVAFRKRALLDVGLWDTDMITDDINVSWKLERRFWAIHYELNAIGWMLVPETFRGFWRQRVRWAQGGVEVMRRHIGIFKDYRTRRLWPLYIDYGLSVVWAFSFVVLTVGWAVAKLFDLDLPANIQASPFPQWNGSVAALMCLLQFAVSLGLDRKYDRSLPHYYLWVIWYPLFYWVFSALATVYATPSALTKKAGTRAIWKSPDRGLRPAEGERTAV
jgi:biofilm PGA synthesis N-glycosyltransferase PgaC